MHIPDGDGVEVDSSTWRVILQFDSSKHYIVKANNVTESACREDLCFERCSDYACRNLCEHNFFCTCQDTYILCKHSHKMHSTIMGKGLLKAEWCTSIAPTLYHNPDVALVDDTAGTDT